MCAGLGLGPRHPRAPAHARVAPAQQTPPAHLPGEPGASRAPRPSQALEQEEDGRGGARDPHGWHGTPNAAAASDTHWPRQPRETGGSRRRSACAHGSQQPDSPASCCKTGSKVDWPRPGRDGTGQRWTQAPADSGSVLRVARSNDRATAWGALPEHRLPRTVCRPHTAPGRHPKGKPSPRGPRGLPYLLGQVSQRGRKGPCSGGIHEHPWGGRTKRLGPPPNPHGLPARPLSLSPEAHPFFLQGPPTRVGRGMCRSAGQRQRGRTARCWGAEGSGRRPAKRPQPPSLPFRRCLSPTRPVFSRKARNWEKKTCKACD